MKIKKKKLDPPLFSVTPSSSMKKERFVKRKKNNLKESEFSKLFLVPVQYSVWKLERDISFGVAGSFARISTEDEGGWIVKSPNDVVKWPPSSFLVEITRSKKDILRERF